MGLLSKQRVPSTPPGGVVVASAENSKELTGAHTSGGACGLIRGYAKNLILDLTCAKALGSRNRKRQRTVSNPEPSTGAAWLSSARVVRCRVKSHAETESEYPLPLVATIKLEDSRGTAGVKPEEGGDDVKSSWPLRSGLHTCYNGVNKGKQKRELKQIPKNTPQFRLKAATRLHEVGIASNRRSATLR